MITVESQRAVRSTPTLPLTTTLGPVRIAVTSRERALAIWQDVVGLDLLSGATHDHVVIADYDHLCVRDAAFKGIFPVGQKGFFGFDVTTADDQPVEDHAAYSAASLSKTLEVAKGQARFRE